MICFTLSETKYVCVRVCENGWQTVFKCQGHARYHDGFENSGVKSLQVSSKYGVEQRELIHFQVLL